MIRYLARRVEHAGQVFQLSIVEIFQDKTGLWHVKISPFEREIHSTPYYNGTLRITDPTDPSQPFTNGNVLQPSVVMG